MELALIRPGEVICAEETLSDGTSLKFSVMEEGLPVEAFLIRHRGRYYAYRNRCAHMALALDLDDNDFFTVDHAALICKTHGAVYRPEDGYCFAGPCFDGFLDPLTVRVQDGKVLLISTERVPDRL